MKREDFTIKFMNGNEEMNVRVLPSGTYETELARLKNSLIVLKEFNYFCTFLVEGKRLTVFDGKYVETNSEELKTELKSVWGGRTDDLFSLLFTIVTTVQR